MQDSPLKKKKKNTYQLMCFFCFFFHSLTNSVGLGREYLFGPALKDKELAIPFGATSAQKHSFKALKRSSHGPAEM